MLTTDTQSTCKTQIGMISCYKCFATSQVTEIQQETDTPQNWKVQKSAIAKNGKSKSFAEQNQPSIMRNI